MAIGDFSGRAHLDACPGALQVHTAADGGLARVRVPGGAVSVAQLRELAACADELGSGVIELTSRANVQVRGLGSAPAFAERMAAAGLLPSDTHERVRNIIASPLSGRSGSTLLDVRPLVAALDLALCARPRMAELSGRFLFALDDGTGDVTGLGADVTLVARSRTAWAVLLAGVEAGTIQVADDSAGVTGDPVGVLVAVADAFLDERAAQGGAAWRLSELEDGPARVAARLHLDSAVVSSPTSDPVRTTAAVREPGLVEQRDGRVALEVVVPLGRLSAAQALLLADAAAATGQVGHVVGHVAGQVAGQVAGRAVVAVDGVGGGDEPPSVRLTPWRTVVVPDLTRAQAAIWTPILTQAGLVADPSSPWVGVSACTGRPGCAKSLADVRADAALGAAEAVHERGLLPVHWAGCERRCGRPRGRVVEVVATGRGYRVELDGDSRTCSDMDEVAAAVAVFSAAKTSAPGTSTPETSAAPVPGSPASSAAASSGPTFRGEK
ncbi:precorrin-3B synthase [Planotetraspora silvatica]|uniref:Precorrin-3B synthase n=1 Tax=Planotetraspora silvatica TaxID=234614 RepID=A0A8J3URV6_9ACTN|nr:precorrin-3B synthase [Planotetraspora silvatica]GII49466.1 precorrin-3B synthase [Planotetraspora silvatica]